MLERIHLSILRAVSDCGTLTAAAEQLHLTQPALSHAIKKLEQQLGTSLWQKDGRAIRLTQAGCYLLNMAERVLPQFEHAESMMAQFAGGERGALRIGMECHPCYQWLLTVVTPYLNTWPNIDLDVKRRFQFGGMAALFSYDIDVLVTPDPLYKQGVHFEAVFDYELVLAVPASHALAGLAYVSAEQLNSETLFTYPVPIGRLDIYTELFIPARCTPKRRKQIEDTDIMMQLVAAGRGVTALPLWLVKQYAKALKVVPLRIGKHGLPKQIHLGVRQEDQSVPYIANFLTTAANS